MFYTQQKVLPSNISSVFIGLFIKGTLKLTKVIKSMNGLETR